MASGRHHWSNAAYSARFFVINAAAAVPLLVLILRPSFGALYAVLATFVFFFVVEKVLKLTIPSFWRAINIWITGRVKVTLNLIKEIGR